MLWIVRQEGARKGERVQKVVCARGRVCVREREGRERDRQRLGEREMERGG